MSKYDLRAGVNPAKSCRLWVSSCCIPWMSIGSGRTRSFVRLGFETFSDDVVEEISEEVGWRLGKNMGAP